MLESARFVPNNPTRSQKGSPVKINYVTSALALFAALLLGVSTAHARRPLDVDCDVLAATNDAVNVILDANPNIDFASVGELFRSAILDDGVFQFLRALILVESGGVIDFTSASQAITTNAQCGLLKDLIDDVND